MKYQNRAYFLLLFLAVFISSGPAFGAEDINETKDVISLTFAGDIMAHNTNYSMKDYSKIYDDVRAYLHEDDLSFANLEFPVQDDKPYRSYPVFNVKSEYVEAAIDGGFDVFAMANNHTCDMGTQGILKTWDAMETFRTERGIYHSGIRNSTKVPMAETAIQYKGWNIGFLSVTQFSNQGDGMALTKIANYNWKSRREELLEDVREMAPNYDLFILAYHGGVEYQLMPQEIKRQFFYDLIEAGVDILWGHHPHVLQPWELIEYQGARKLILYSCGNFISGQTWMVTPTYSDPTWENHLFTGDSALFRVFLKKNGEKGTIFDFEPLLVSNYRDPKDGMVVKRLEAFSQENLSEGWNGYYKSRNSVVGRFMRRREPTYLE